MALRIQHERMTGEDKLDATTFYREWGLGADQPQARQARRDRDAPRARSIAASKLTSEVADGPHSVIRQQVDERRGGAHGRAVDDRAQRAGAQRRGGRRAS